MVFNLKKGYRFKWTPSNLQNEGINTIWPEKTTTTTTTTTLKTKTFKKHAKKKKNRKTANAILKSN